LSHAATLAASHDAMRRALRQLRAGIEIPAAYGVLDDRLRPRLLAYFQAHGFRREDAEDLVQTTLARVYGSVADLRDDDRFLPWLFVIARNERRRALARRQREPTVTGVEDEEDEEDEVERVADPAPEAAIETAAIATERRRALETAIGNLAPQQRQCLLLRVVHDLSYQEIAATLRLSVHTVRNHLAAARKGLRQMLGEEIDEPGDL
jgi:RNA polymerase sigma-70 factor (ECF subfamily)